MAGSVATFVLIIASWVAPWWRLTVGTPALAEANFSPINLNFSVLGNFLSIPIVWALNIAALLTLISGGAVLLIYSFRMNRPYSKKLLGFGYNKPLFAVVLFVVELIVLAVLAKTVVGIDVPLMGSANIQLPQIAEGASVKVVVSAAFEWPFYFAIAVAGLCVAARLYHRKIMRSELQSTQSKI